MEVEDHSHSASQAADIEALAVEMKVGQQVAVTSIEGKLLALEET